MLSDLLTTKELQEILHVDRTTIYRMADSGRVPAVKVGNQWRFPREQIELWLQRQSSAPLKGQELPISGNSHAPEIFPLDCVQLIQDSFADALGVMMLVTDLRGNPITVASNPCGLFLAAEKSPVARERCLSLWIDLANKPSLAPRFQESHLGLMCARGLVRVGSEIKAMLVVGGIAPEVWPPNPPRVTQMATELELDQQVIEASLDQVHHLSQEDQVRVLPYVQRIADILSHIASERNQLFARLQRISEISKV